MPGTFVRTPTSRATRNSHASAASQLNVRPAPANQRPRLAQVRSPRAVDHEPLVSSSPAPLLRSTAINASSLSTHATQAQKQDAAEMFLMSLNKLYQSREVSAAARPGSRRKYTGYRNALKVGGLWGRRRGRGWGLIRY